MPGNSPNPKEANGQEPHQHNGAECLSDPRCPLGLNEKQGDQNHDRRRKNIERANEGATIFSPSTADNTEIAGVMAPSP